MDIRGAVRRFRERNLSREGIADHIVGYVAGDVVIAIAGWIVGKVTGLPVLTVATLIVVALLGAFLFWVWHAERQRSPAPNQPSPVFKRRGTETPSSGHFPSGIGERTVLRSVGEHVLAVTEPRFPSAPSRIVHKSECPNTYIEVEEKDSVEGDKVTVTRCTECGEQVVLKAADKRRLELGLPNWAAWHAWSPFPEVSMKGVWLGVKSLDGSRLAVYLCKVTGPFGEAIWNLSNNAFGQPVQPEDSRGCLFPDQLWKDAPGLPLKAGEYDVEWFADNNGFDLPVKHDLFVVEGGRLAR
ncbi:MAG: hypothetical protein ACRDHO_00500 [Actinomycetota bacterium]